jgi:hypothetical protein
MKKYDYTISTRVPQVIAEEMKKVCDSANVNESDFVRQSLITELKRHEIYNPSFEYI